MKKSFLFVVIALLLISAAACSSTKPPAAPAVQGNRIIASLKDLSDNYEKKNLKSFMNLISGNFKDRQALAGTLESVFSKYEILHFTVQYSKMVILIEDKGLTKATFNWDSDWQTAGGSVLKNSGRATFSFEPRDGKLVSIDGKNPFIPQAIETPGMQG